MALGPGKYDNLATYVREQTGAQAVVLIVVGGHKGAGFCVQCRDDTSVRLPALLRSLADGIEADLGATEQ
jgi:hypothetical protein